LRQNERVHLDRLDLNLLVALDALLAEQSVTRAAGRLSLSQPAMSGALTRLREHFEDELITRVGRSMVLTPFGAGLAPRVRDLLSEISMVANARAAFNPASAERQFTLVASDYALSLMLPLIVPRLAAAAPNITLHAEVRGPDHEERFARGLVDLVIVPQSMALQHHPTLPLFTDEYVCIAWKGNREIAEELTLETYLRLGHAIRVNRASGAPMLDELAINELGYRRKVVLSVSSFELLPLAIAGTPLIASLQRRLAEQFARIHPITIHPHPVDIRPLELSLQWPAFRDDDPGGRWLRQLFVTTADEELRR
jgi:LysR family transcriptional regulator, nod-box dependent transcriptional activator